MPAGGLYRLQFTNGRLSSSELLNFVCIDQLLIQSFKGSLSCHPWADKNGRLLLSIVVLLVVDFQDCCLEHNFKLSFHLSGRVGICQYRM